MQNNLQKFIYTFRVTVLFLSSYQFTLTTSDWFEDPNKVFVTSNYRLNPIVCLYVHVVDYFPDDIMPTDPPDI